MPADMGDVADCLMGFGHGPRSGPSTQPQGGDRILGLRSRCPRYVWMTVAPPRPPHLGPGASPLAQSAQAITGAILKRETPEHGADRGCLARAPLNPQKEQYFRKRFRDQATAVISHIKSIRSLHIMSHIPVFCWILSTVIQKLLEQTEQPELPQTLTQIGSGVDLHWTPETREMVRSLGKLAFEQLQKGNLIFYECDLSECGLDAAVASVYSGVFTQVFREEPGLYQDKVYCFIHLSVQEFLAALHVHQTFTESGVNLLEVQQTSFLPRLFKNKTELSFLQRSAVDQALQSPNGHLDLFLRFLLGLSLPTNQSLPQGLLTQTESDQANQKTVKYIKQAE
ncbi:protein NLRC3-like [Periophthalmus magnuspinnatus]|uniref:protein NLRC3-like n=1 Tax=Periophthalmus magnuspinnatus TaxID=409849 RepID=UPI0024363291|nr:protein NLRC3-like [Periophthalmus magnuspinnatus]